MLTKIQNNSVPMHILDIRTAGVGVDVLKLRTSVSKKC